VPQPAFATGDWCEER